MLTKMKRENMGFDAALKIAQQLAMPKPRIPATMWMAVMPAAKSPS